MTPNQVLQKYWGYASLRSHQIPIVDSVLEGRDTFALLTTGGGKSICFQLPAMMKPGICIVVSPLIALMKDQVMALNHLQIPAAAYYSSQSTDIQKRIMDYAISDRLKFLYISPERLISRDFLQRMKEMNVSYLVIDEAHCISQWGYDFRPSYLNIPWSYSFLGNIPKIVLTATATPIVVQDIIEKLELKNENLIVSSFQKPNLSYQVHLCETKIEQLVQWLKKMKGSGLVYVSRRIDAEKLVKQLGSQFGILADYYHAGLSVEVRNEKQENWLENPNSLMISTNAFGMGIDNPHVNFIIHYHFPDTLEAYFQEAGRAGRAGQSSFAFSLVAQSDIQEKKDQIANYPTVAEVKAMAILLYNYYDIPYELGENFKSEFIIEDFIEKYKLNMIQTQKCIQILKDNEIIRITEAFYQPDELRITANDEELRTLEIENPSYRKLIENLIRSYDGIFYKRKISLQKIAKNYHYHISELKSMLFMLHKWGLVDYSPSTNKPILEFLINKVGKEQVPIDEAQYKLRKKVITDQLTAVISYLENKKTCRSIQLLSYFGESNSKECGICDTCISHQKSKNISKEDYLLIKDKIMDVLEKKVYHGIDKLIKINKPQPEFAIRKVIDRLLELRLIEKGEGESFKLK